jgi:DNA-binding response OmpR family regulator
MNPPIRVIVVEDNDLLLDELLFQLEAQGFMARGAVDGPALDRLLAEAPADILVLDINLPGEDGFSLARRLRDPARLGIIMQTARDAIDDKLRGLDGGADLYLVKPVDRRELAASIKAVYRRLPSAAPHNDLSGWRLLRERRALIAPDGRQLDLSPMELKILDWLRLEQGRTRSRRDLLQLLGIDGLSASDGRVNTSLSRLRQKLCEFDSELRIVSWRGQGYSYVGPLLGVD